MNIRLMGSRDLIEQADAAMSQAGLSTRQYPNRPPSTEMRLYCQVDDRRMAELLSRFTKPNPRRQSKKQTAIKAEEARA